MEESQINLISASAADNDNKQIKFYVTFMNLKDSNSQNQFFMSYYSKYQRESCVIRHAKQNKNSNTWIVFAYKSHVNIAIQNLKQFAQFKQLEIQIDEIKQKYTFQQQQQSFQNNDELINFQIYLVKAAKPLSLQQLSFLSFCNFVIEEDSKNQTEQIKLVFKYVQIVQSFLQQEINDRLLIQQSFTQQQQQQYFQQQQQNPIQQKSFPSKHQQQNPFQTSPFNKEETISNSLQLDTPDILFSKQSLSSNSKNSIRSHYNKSQALLEQTNTFKQIQSQQQQQHQQQQSCQQKKKKNNKFQQLQKSIKPPNYKQQIKTICQKTDQLKAEQQQTPQNLKFNNISNNYNNINDDFFDFNNPNNDQFNNNNNSNNDDEFLKFQQSFPTMTRSQIAEIKKLF